MIPHDPDLGEVSRKDLVHGFEFEKGHYVILSNEELNSVKLESTRMIDIDRFVDLNDIDRVYWHTPYYVTPSGKPGLDAYVVIREAMRAGGYNVGGEPSGHIILSDYNTTGDGFVAALQLLAVIRNQEKLVSQVCHRFEPLPQVLKNVRYKAGKPLENAGVKSAISAAEQKLGRGGRLIIRLSGTEPVIRVMGEGDDKMLVETVVDDIVSALSKAAA